jgi:hypothetical protein
MDWYGRHILAARRGLHKPYELHVLVRPTRDPARTGDEAAPLCRPWLVGP